MVPRRNNMGSYRGRKRDKCFLMILLGENPAPSRNPSMLPMIGKFSYFDSYYIAVYLFSF